MKTVLLTIVCLIFYWTSLAKFIKNDDTLILIHTLFRHGNRTPDLISIAPNDPYINETYFPYGYGELTNEGKRTEYHLGKTLRKRYGDFLGKLYTPNILYARSTGLNRTKMSLELVLAGLFPPMGEQIFEEGLNWQPIPFFYEEPVNDELLLSLTCPSFKKFYKNDETAKITAQYQKYFPFISKHSGRNITSLKDVFVLYYGFITEEEWGFTLPSWTREIPGEILYEMIIQYYHTVVGTTDLKKVVSGPLLKKILADTKAKIDGTLSPDGRKIFLYSAHEFNVASLLITLNVFKPQIPPYGACIIMEVHEIEDGYGIKIFYHDYSQSEPHVLKLPECEELCPIDQFETIIEEFIPSDDFCKN